MASNDVETYLSHRPTLIDGSEQASAFTLLTEQLEPLCSGITASVVGFRLIVARLGEADVFRWWPSRIHEIGDLSLSPLFPKTWPRQRLLLSLEAARSAETEVLPNGNTPKARTLFRLGPAFDAHAERCLRMLDVDRCMALGRQLTSIAHEPGPDIRALATAARTSVVDENDPIAVFFAELCDSYGDVDPRHWMPPYIDR